MSIAKPAFSSDAYPDAFRIREAEDVDVHTKHGVAKTAATPPLALLRYCRPTGLRNKAITKLTSYCLCKAASYFVYKCRLQWSRFNEIPQCTSNSRSASTLSPRMALYQPVNVRPNFARGDIPESRQPKHRH